MRAGTRTKRNERTSEPLERAGAVDEIDASECARESEQQPLPERLASYKRTNVYDRAAVVVVTHL